jgi:hypothetical protein
MRVRAAVVLFFALCPAACGTRSELYPAAGAPSGGANAGSPAGGDGAAGASGGEDAAVIPCTVASDCPAGATACLEATCEAGACGTRALARGTRVGGAAPRMCHAIVCDGAGNVVTALDPSNVPITDPCIAVVCAPDGSPGLLSVAAGTTCGPAGAWSCDGLGACVQCLTTAMCAAGQACVQHACVSPSCTNKTRDGDESDVDCGGSCPGCAVGQRCSSRRDCASTTCDPGTRRCVPDPCHDGVRGGDETDVDCGGSCPRCADGHRCKVDFDCASDDCDPAQLACLPVTCIDQRQDAKETDVDCGGGVCPPCVPGKGCLVDADCSVGCDLVTHLCSGNVCADHRRNALETDVDCGGGVCSGCLPGKMCNTNGDCTPGHLCNGAKVCQ